MALWFECKVRYDKMQENGMVKKVNEPYHLGRIFDFVGEEDEDFGDFLQRRGRPLLSGEG